MLADSRSRALIDNFVSQWLQLGKLTGLVPDPDAFPDFDENLREAMRRETYGEVDPACVSKLADLKDRIRRSGCPVMDGYPARWDPDVYDRGTRTRGIRPCSC